MIKFGLFLAAAASVSVLGLALLAAPPQGRLHIISSSHQDIAWMDSPEKCIAFRDTNCITPALAMMAKDPAYSFTMENMLNLTEYLERHPERAEEVARLTREGRMEWGATFNQPYESLLSGEQLVREAYLGRLWLKRTIPGADARVYFNPDVPGRAAQMPQILAKAGIPYLVMSRYHEGFYRWASPDGSSVLAYSPGPLRQRRGLSQRQAGRRRQDDRGQGGQVVGLLRAPRPARRVSPAQFRRLLPADRLRAAHQPLERGRGGDGRREAGHAVLDGPAFLRVDRRQDGQARDDHRREAGPVALHPRPDPPLGDHGGPRSRASPARGRGLQHGRAPAERQLRHLSGKPTRRRMGSRHLSRSRLGRQGGPDHRPPLPQEVRVRPGRGPSPAPKGPVRYRPPRLHKTRPRERPSSYSTPCPGHRPPRQP